MHRQQHQVGILDQLLHPRWEFGDCGPIQDPMISRNWEIDCLCRHELTLILVPWSIGVRFTNCNNSSLGSQDSRHEISATNVANRWNTESRISEVTSSELISSCLFDQSFQVTINLQNRLGLAGLDVGYGQSFLRVNSHGEVVVLLNHKSLNETIIVEVIIDLWVHDRVFGHSDRASLNEEGKHGQLRVLFFHFFP